MQAVRDRIKDFRRVKAAELRAHPRNWRTHPGRQQAALSRVLQEIGYADALLARELPDGSLELIDGHLRAATTPDQLVPVLVLDVDEGEAEAILATLDPLASMAETDSRQLDALLRDVERQHGSLSRALEEVRKSTGFSEELLEHLAQDESDALQNAYHVLVECRDEAEQRALLSRFAAEGLSCRALFV